jgi:hypothetical protein
LHPNHLVLSSHSLLNLQTMECYLKSKNICFLFFLAWSNSWTQETFWSKHSKVISQVRPIVYFQSTLPKSGQSISSLRMIVLAK